MILIITYEGIRKVLVDEKKATKPVALPDGFFEKVKIYLDNKSKVTDKKESIWEVESAQRLLKDFFEIRERKILTLALYSVRSGITVENLTEEERIFFDKLVASLKEFQEKRKGMMSGEEIIEKSMIAILKDVPEFVATNMKTYGPFKEGEVVSLPKDAGEVLVKREDAREIEAN
ncbi:MAG: hypothetical protein ABIH55_02980 [Nanoarchaeota archaeon]